MPIKIQGDLPVKEILEHENIFVMDEHRAIHQDIRPIRILILNLMPLKEDTELQLLRSLSNTPLQVDVTFMAVKTHESKNTSMSHLNKFYQTFEELKDTKYDGMIVTGAPVEQMEFEEVDYWEEMKQILDWIPSHVTSTIYLCWAVMDYVMIGHISARYGDRWIYPVTKGSRIIGAMEIWEMSGCLEVRSVDLDSPEMLSDVLTALDKFMEFYRQKGIEIIRIREILSVDAADLDGSVKDTLSQFGYVFINGFYAKGRFVTRVMTHDEALSYIFRKQRLEKTSRFGTFDELIAERGYVRSDQELPCRVAGRTSLKKQMELGTVVKSILCPTYVGYIDPARLPVLRTAKKVPLTGEQVALQKIVAAKQPISKKNLMFQSPYSYKVTTETISEMTRLSLIYQDGDSAYCLAEPADMTQEEALKQIARWHFKDFGIFSAERLAQFLNSRMAVTRKILAELEDEGYISKGFLLEGDPSLYWMLSEDVVGYVANPQLITDCIVLLCQWTCQYVFSSAVIV